MTSVVIASAIRTAIGTFGGSLKDHTPIDLGTHVASAAIERAGMSPEEIDHTFFGSVIHSEPKDMYLSRAVAIGAGVPEISPALTVNRLCGSGLQAVVNGYQSIVMEDADVVLAGGAECMSRAGFLDTTGRWGQRLGDIAAKDMLLGALTDPFGNGHMGLTAENIAENLEISREKQDQFSLESHQRASSAIKAGYFKEQIAPIEVGKGKRKRLFDQDEHVRTNIKQEDLEKLTPAFKKEGSVTAGNSSGINDGASALILMSEVRAREDGIKPLARILSYGVSGIDPALMGLGPVSAMEKALDRIGFHLNELDIIESNEAFAAQACGVNQTLGLDGNKVNPNGGAIALGHPIGASGAIILTKLVHELQRTGKELGAATMCIGGGQGIAVIVENCG